jgi:hypothetical protein
MREDINRFITEDSFGARGSDQLKARQAAELEFDQEDIWLTIAKLAQAESSIGGKIDIETDQPQPEQEHQAREAIALNKKDTLAWCTDSGSINSRRR